MRKFLLTKLNILIVEDNHLQCKYLEEVIEDCGISDLNINVTDTLGGAIEKSDKKKFDLVFLDLHLPDSIGLETLKNFRKHNSQSSIIVFTAESDESIALKAIIHGAQYYLLKGKFDKHTLRKAIFFSYHRKKQELRLMNQSEQFSNLISHLSGVVYRCKPDKEWSVEFISKGIKALSGFSTSDFLVLKMPLSKLIHPDDYKGVSKKLISALMNKQTYEMDYRIIHKSGEIRWVHEQGEGIFNKKGDLLYRDGLILDVTCKELAREEQKRLNDMLNSRMKELNCLYTISELASNHNFSQEELLSKIVESIPSGWQYSDIACACIFLFDKQYHSNDFRSTKWRQSADISIEGKKAGSVVVYYKEKRPESDEGPFCKEERYLLNNIAERISRTIASKQALEEKLILEQQLNNSRKLESIGTLAAGIAHEINTPVQFIGDNVSFIAEALDDLLEYIDQMKSLAASSICPDLKQEFKKFESVVDMEYLKQEIPEAVSQTREGLERVSRIVNAMKDFSHIGSDDMIKTDINKTIENIIIISRNSWKYVADLEKNLDPNLPMVACVAHDISQSVMNLIINAADAIADTIEGTDDRGKITVSTESVDNSIHITVTDTGTGIHESIQDKIFDHFFTTKQVGKGTGQGLSIVYSTIVEKHKGNLTFDSVYGKGTTFCIELPIEQVEIETNEA